MTSQDKQCPKCKGTGKVTLTHTPTAFSKPRKNPIHKKKCFICGGTGVLDSDSGPFESYWHSTNH